MMPQDQIRLPSVGRHLLKCRRATLCTRLDFKHYLKSTILKNVRHTLVLLLDHLHRSTVPHHNLHSQHLLAHLSQVYLPTGEHTAHLRI